MGVVITNNCTIAVEPERVVRAAVIEVTVIL